MLYIKHINKENKTTSTNFANKQINKIINLFIYKIEYKQNIDKDFKGTKTIKDKNKEKFREELFNAINAEKHNIIKLIYLLNNDDTDKNVNMRNKFV